MSPYGGLWAAAAHHRRQAEDAGSGALAAETTDLGVGPLRPLVMRMLHDEGMQPEATSNGLPGHVEQAMSQAGGGHSAVGPSETLSGGPAAPCAGTAGPDRHGPRGKPLRLLISLRALMLGGDS